MFVGDNGYAKTRNDERRNCRVITLTCKLQLSTVFNQRRSQNSTMGRGTKEGYGDDPPAVCSAQPNGNPQRPEITATNKTNVHLK